MFLFWLVWIQQGKRVKSVFSGQIKIVLVDLGAEGCVCFLVTKSHPGSIAPRDSLCSLELPLLIANFPSPYVTMSMMWTGLIETQLPCLYKQQANITVLQHLSLSGHYNVFYLQATHWCV